MPARIIDEEIKLIPYYRNDEASLPWYQDLDVCKQVDNRDEPYDRELLHSMYDYLSSHGDCYYIEYKGTLVGFILTFSDGVKAYFSGDTSTTPSMAGFAEKKLDYAFLCCDGVYNMDVKEASECAKTIGAKHTIPYHMEPVKDKSGFDLSVAESFDAPGKIILKPGGELVLE